MSKILSAHQPAYLPWLGYLHKIALSDEFIILDKVQFEKNSFINRNKILTPNGPQWLTIPIHLKGHTKNTISDIEIDSSDNWELKHWKSILLNYKKAQFFTKYSPFFENMYNKKWKNVTSLTQYFLSFILKELNIKTKIILQSSLQISSKKQRLIIDLCKNRQAATFIFGELGSNYVNKNLFKLKNINIVFQKYNCQDYSPLWGNFIPGLSCIDSLFNIGPQKTAELLFQKNISKSDIIKQ